MKKVLMTLGLFVLLLTSNQSFAGGGHHHCGVFVGFTNNTHLKHTDLTFGVDYEYRISGLFGAGVIGDLVLAEHTETLVMGGLFIHPTCGLKFVIGNGLAFTEHESIVEDHGHSEVHSETESHYVLRVGTAYDFHIGDFSISPALNWDYINGHSSVAYGVIFGFGF